MNKGRQLAAMDRQSFISGAKAAADTMAILAGNVMWRAGGKAADFTVATGRVTILEKYVQKSSRGATQLGTPAMDDTQGPGKRIARQRQGNQGFGFHFAAQCRLGEKRHAGPDGHRLLDVFDVVEFQDHFHGYTMLLEKSVD